MKFLLAAASVIFASSTFAVTKINGAGATFPYPIYSKWFSEYKNKNSQIEINYQSIGSGGGIRQVVSQTVDFGASDAPMSDKDKSGAPYKITHIPTVLGAVVPVFNLKDVKSLKLDGETLANIFMGKITKWNHPTLMKLNPEAKLPNEDILVVRRADGSGTTSVFADYLSSVSKEWESSIGRGKSLQWPVGIGSKGNEGVTATVKQTEGAIGYVELSYAITNQLNMASMKNSAGEFVTPSIESVSKAAEGVSDPSGEFTSSIVNSSAKGSFPIASFTYILLPEKKDDSKNKEIKKFLKWALTDGQKFAKELHYAPLPSKVAKQVVEKLK
ncbi:MAG: phosphate ABC transporter substrate-binding protein PstS [Bdellovibrio sp.]